MLETQQDVGEIVKSGMRELKLDKRGHIDFHPMLPDAVGLTGASHDPIVWEYPPRWMIYFRYPADESDAKTCVLDLNTANFETLDEVRQFVVQSIWEQLS